GDGARGSRGDLRPRAETVAQLAAWIGRVAPRELAQQVATGVVLHRRHPHPRLDVEVAALLALRTRQPALAQPEALAALGAGGDLDRHRAVRRRHLHVGAE